MSYCGISRIKFLRCYLGQESLSKEILNLNGLIPGKRKVKNHLNDVADIVKQMWTEYSNCANVQKTFSIPLLCLMC